MPRSRTRPPNILTGIVRVATGRRDGLARFSATREGFLASLAPLLAFPLVGGVMMLVGGQGRVGATQFLATLCAILAPPVLSFELARLWGRLPAWLRFATALNWCQWAIPVVAVLLLGIAAPLLAAVMPDRVAVEAIIGVVGCYALWLHWFIAYHGLDISRLRAGVLVVVVNAGTALLVLGPALLAGP